MPYSMTSFRCVHILIELKFETNNFSIPHIVSHCDPMKKNHQNKLLNDFFLVIFKTTLTHIHPSAQMLIFACSM
jgi:hypothetical protein